MQNIEKQRKTAVAAVHLRPLSSFGVPPYTRRMEINLVAIAVGNSRVQVASFTSGELLEVHRCDRADAAEVDRLIKAAWAKSSAVGDVEIAAASVVPLANSEIDRLVFSHSKQHVQWVGKDLDLPIKLATREPTKTGIDRALAAAAAFEQLGKACVVVDAGTCITVNLVDDKGQLVGGTIAPGVALMLRALHEGTASLPDIAYERPSGNWGTDTTSSIRHGITQMIHGLVKEQAEYWATEQGTWPEVIATGGDAPTLFADWEIVHAVSPDLVLYGIALAYSEHHIRHGS